MRRAIGCLLLAGCSSATPNAADASLTDTGVLDRPRSDSAPSDVECADARCDAATAGRFITVSPIELRFVQRISRFRSGVGHDYSDGAERCRSMKHYFEPRGDLAWDALPVRSPVAGFVAALREEWAGTQVELAADADPSVHVVVFHVVLDRPMAVGERVDAGQRLGHHIGAQTLSDVAVRRGERLISFVELMSPALLAELQSRGVADASALIITQSARDADPLACDGEQFSNEGHIENWVTLTPPARP